MQDRVYEGVAPLLSNANGWGYREFSLKYHPGIFLSGSPDNLRPSAFQTELEQAYLHTRTNRPTDYNGEKAALMSYSARSGRLHVEIASTDYFTLRGLYHTAPDLHEKSLKDLEETHQTQVPIGISAHTILLAQDKAVMTLNNASHGFAPGRLSLSFEGQMDPPPKDSTPFHTVQRELEEELGKKVRLDAIKLLAIAGETGSNYTSWCFVVKVNAPAESLKDSWETAKTRETSALLMAPIVELGQIILPGTQSEALQHYLVAGSLDPSKTITPHATVPWRYDCLLEHLSARKSG